MVFACILRQKDWPMNARLEDVGASEKGTKTRIQCISLFAERSDRLFIYWWGCTGIYPNLNYSTLAIKTLYTYPLEKPLKCYNCKLPSLDQCVGVSDVNTNLRRWSDHCWLSRWQWDIWYTLYAMTVREEWSHVGAQSLPWASISEKRDTSGFSSHEL